MAVETAAERYDDTRAQLRDEFVRAKLLLRRHLAACWDSPENTERGVGGYYVSDEEVDRLLRPSPWYGEGEESDANRSDLDRAIQEATTQARHRESRSLEADLDLRLSRLVAEFDLTRLERDALILALAPDVDRSFEKVYGYLRDDITKVRPTIGLIRQVLAGADADSLTLVELLDRQSTLRTERLVEVVEGPTNPGSEVRVSPRVIAYLLGSDAVADSIDAFATIVTPDRGVSDIAIDMERREQLSSLVSRLDPSDEQSDSPWLFAAFVGPDERAASIGVEGVCSALETPVLRVDGGALSGESADETLAAIRRESRLRHCPVHFTEMDALVHNDTGRSNEDSGQQRRDDGRLDQVITTLDEIPGHVFVTGDAPVTAAIQPRLEQHRYVGIDFPRPDYGERERIWNTVDGLPDDIDIGTLAGLFRLTRGQIEDAVETAGALDAEDGTVDTLFEACRMHSQSDLDRLARRVDPAYTWEDIVLPQDTLVHLQEVTAQIRHRGTVYEGWGFEDRFSLGNGINLLFTGPSGTGKTMAAEIIAGDIGLPMYKLDLSNILSKYIGETEKNLGRVFDQAEHSNALLFFDEADALFGKRTEIGDSRDRYANVEVDYLLQRMEEHDGCVILATNLEENVDDAFKRRINGTVEFPMPDEDARRKIWGSIFPDDTPVDEIDFEYLADFELAGGSIKNVALTAAFMAAEDGGPVGMEHLVRAMRREFQKIGKLYDTESFGEEYQSLVD